ncbi:hypothetical protein C8R48DRAFT_736747 [Suillus tomentosus]|nr:hypothetical protein C8R48DRAFT_736747 [Suillus tomentosus]
MIQLRWQYTKTMAAWLWLREGERLMAALCHFASCCLRSPDQLLATAKELSIFSRESTARISDQGVRCEVVIRQETRICS